MLEEPRRDEASLLLDRRDLTLVVVTLDFLSLGEPFIIVFRLLDIEDFFCFLSSFTSLSSDDEEEAEEERFFPSIFFNIFSC